MKFAGNSSIPERLFQIFVKELNRAGHGEREGVRQVVVISRVGIELDGAPSCLDLFCKRFGKLNRNFAVFEGVVEL